MILIKYFVLIYLINHIYMDIIFGDDWDIFDLLQFVMFDNNF